MGTPIFDYIGASEHRDALLKGWSSFPWIVNAAIPDEMDTATSYNLIEGQARLIGGECQQGNCTVLGHRWVGFKTEDAMNKFRAIWPHGCRITPIAGEK